MPSSHPQSGYNDFDMEMFYALYLSVMSLSRILPSSPTILSQGSTKPSDSQGHLQVLSACSALGISLGSDYKGLSPGKTPWWACGFCSYTCCKENLPQQGNFFLKF